MPFKPGNIPWNTGKKLPGHGAWRGKKLSEEHKKRISQGLFSSETKIRKVDPGEGVLYSSIHNHIRRKKGIASKCTSSECSGTCKNYEWSLIHGRDPYKVDSYVEMCISCHRKYDKAHKNLRRVVNS